MNRRAPTYYPYLFSNLQTFLRTYSSKIACSMNFSSSNMMFFKIVLAAPNRLLKIVRVLQIVTIHQSLHTYTL